MRASTLPQKSKEQKNIQYYFSFQKFYFYVSYNDVTKYVYQPVQNCLIETYFSPFIIQDSPHTE